MSDKKSEARFSIPDGHVILPRELFESLQRDAEAWRHHVRSLGPEYLPMGRRSVCPPGDVMPICGCKVGSMCMNTACPHRQTVTCDSIGGE